MSNHLEATLERAASLLRGGQHSEAESACRSILGTHPGHSGALNLLGIITGHAGRMEESAECFRRALADGQRSPAILSNLAEAMRRSGRIAETVPILREAVSLQPDYTQGWGKLVLTLSEMGRTDEALAACMEGLAQLPEEPRLCGLAAELLIRQRKAAEALPYLYVALERAPGIDAHWVQLCRMLNMGFLQSTRARPLLLQALAHPLIRPADIATSIAVTLCKDPTIARLIGNVQPASLPDQLRDLGSDTLLVALMQTEVIANPDLERLFTGLRHALLSALTVGDAPSSAHPALAFCTALATQAFLTEYAWFVTDEEEVLVKRLINESSGTLDPLRLTVIASYCPLHELVNAKELARRRWPEPLGSLVRIQVEEPLEERALRAQIPSLSPVSNPVSQKVRAQYEENPYPRWVRAEQERPKPLPWTLRIMGAEIPADASFGRPEVLIAGCGTGQQALIAATSYESANVLAVDLSLASLAHALRKTRELGIGNIEYRHGDILELGDTERRFHVIECSGVLHHMADPMAGWRVLVDLLHPGGLLIIGLYSELGRQTVVQAREKIAACGYRATTGDIRRFRKEILELPDGHPLATLRQSIDMYSISGCRDLLFHVQEYRFTIPEIQRALDAFGLRFLRFNLSDTSGYRDRFPDDPRMTSLENWHAYEAERPETFRKMYQFVVQKACRGQV